jgi:hypothetical protein
MAAVAGTVGQGMMSPWLASVASDVWKLSVVLPFVKGESEKSFGTG